MNITEIVIIPSRENNIAEYQSYFSNIIFDDNIPSNLKQLGLKWGVTTQDGVEYYGMVDIENKLVAILKVDSERLNKAQISYTQTSEDYRNKGVLRWLANKALDKYRVLYSDSHQTPASVEFWKHMINFPGTNQNVFVYNIEDDTKIPASIKTDDEIWNQKESPLLVLSRHKLTESEKKYADNNTVWREKNNISEYDMFYFSYDISKGYYNP
jgi:hypothetical protein